MIELWGADNCESCVEAKKYLQQTPLEWQPVDVATTLFEGMIPRLILENGDNIVGFPAIKGYVKRRMREMGFSKEMMP